MKIIYFGLQRVRFTTTPDSGGSSLKKGLEGERVKDDWESEMLRNISCSRPPLSRFSYQLGVQGPYHHNHESKH